MANESDVTVEVARRLLEVIAGEVTDNKSELARRVHERHVTAGGTRQDVSSTKTTIVDRAYRSVGENKGLTVQQATELLGVLGLEGDQAIERFIAKYMQRDEAALLMKLHEGLKAQEAAAYAYRDQSAAEFSDCRIYGSVIELRRFRNIKMEDWRWGIPVDAVELVRTSFPFPVAEELRFPSIKPPPPNWPKYTLHDILPADTDDANDGRVQLHLSSTDFFTVKQCDPSIYDDYGDAATFEADGQVVTNADRQENRRVFGNLSPRRSRVPYCLTIFFTIILRDGHVLFMRRSPHVAWFPNMVEFSGGEQLKEEDFQSDRPFATWVRRAIMEEFLPSSHLNPEQAQALEREFFGQAYLAGIGFDTVTCSFPVFCLYRSQCNLQEYLGVYGRARLQRSATRPDNEGTICVVNRRELELLLSRGWVRGLAMRSSADTVGFELETRDEPAALVRLNPEELHPMTAYRLGLLVDVMEG